jgi:hypothetical protein
LVPLVAAEQAAEVAAGAEGIDLVDEHGRRGAGPGVIEQVARPGCVHGRAGLGTSAPVAREPGLQAHAYAR